MKRLIIFIVGCLPMQNIAFAQIPLNDRNWQLKWEDDFSAFDTINRWVRAHHCDHYNSQPRLYLKENVWVADSTLVIEINSDEADCLSPTPPTGACSTCVPEIHYYYTSGWVETKTPSKYDTQFGHIEARVKMPYGKKFFHHAFWVHVGNVPHSNPAEIDIFENLGWLPVNVITTNVHPCYHNSDSTSPGYNPDCDERYYYAVHEFSDFDYRDWHTYAIEWDADRIIWYLDNNPIRTVIDHGIIDPTRIIFNVNMSGTYAPTIPPPFRDRMYVDYIKVHQLKYDCDTTVVNEIYDFNTYNYAVKKSITLSGATNFGTITSEKRRSISLRASDFIALQPGFEVPLGVDIYMDVNPCSQP